MVAVAANVDVDAVVGFAEREQATIRFRDAHDVDECYPAVQQTARRFVVDGTPVDPQAQQGVARRRRERCNCRHHEEQEERGSREASHGSLLRLSAHETPRRGADARRRRRPSFSRRCSARGRRRVRSSRARKQDRAGRNDARIGLHLGLQRLDAAAIELVDFVVASITESATRRRLRGTRASRRPASSARPPRSARSRPKPAAPGRRSA